jgi:hypothetical protein
MPVEPCPFASAYADLAHEFLQWRGTGQRIAIVMFKDA